MIVHWRNVLLIFCATTLGLAAPAMADLRIVEILSAPATDWDGDAAVDVKLDEWVEVLNTGPDPVDLTDCYLRDGTGTAWHFGFAGTLAAGEVLLVTGADALAWQTANGAGSSGLSLNNTGDLVEIVRAPEGGSEELLDSVAVPAHAAATDRAYAWLQFADQWILHDGLNPYGGSMDPAGTGCDPSPGALNLCSTGVPAETSSVGRLKASYEH